MSDLLYSPEIRKIESRFLSLFERTIKKGLLGIPANAIPSKVQAQFRSETFRLQLENILDDLVLLAVEDADKTLGSFSGSIRRDFKPIKAFASIEVFPLTEELVMQSTELSGLIVQSIIEVLKEEGIYQLHPTELAERITELWNGEKYRAVRFTRTFSSDVANNTTLHRYRQHKITAWEFYAKLDDRTTIQCQMLHGTIFYTDSKNSDRYRPPLHFHCRSSMLPIPVTQQIDESRVFENRDFSELQEQDIRLDPKIVEDGLSEIEKFKQNYSIDKFILQEDIEKRLLKLGVGLDTVST